MEEAQKIWALLAPQKEDASVTSNTLRVNVTELNEKDFLLGVVNILKSEKAYITEEEQSVPLAKDLVSSIDDNPPPTIPEGSPVSAEDQQTVEAAASALAKKTVDSTSAAFKPIDSWTSSYTIDLLARVIGDHVLYHNCLESSSSPSCNLREKGHIDIEAEDVCPYRTVTFDTFTQYLRWEAKLRVQNKLR